LKQASKAAEDIIRKSWADVKKMKQEANKVLELSKTLAEKKRKEADLYAANKKSDADIYLKNKMAEADKAATDFQKQMKKNGAATLTDAKGAKPAMADKILSEILNGMAAGDYQSFTKNFTKELKKNITEKNFRIMTERLKEKIGGYVSRQYMGTVRKGPWTVYLWKAKYEKAKNNDLILRLVLGNLDGKLQVFGFDVSNI
jgi:exonuclease VII large subunit